MPPHNQQVRVLARGESVTLTSSGSWAESTHQHVNEPLPPVGVNLNSGRCTCHGEPVVVMVTGRVGGKRSPGLFPGPLRWQHL